MEKVPGEKVKLMGPEITGPSSTDSKDSKDLTIKKKKKAVK